MKHGLMILMLLFSMAAFSAEDPSGARLIDFENPGLIDQTGTFSPEFMNEQNLRIREFTEKTGILLRIIYTSTADITTATGTLLRGIEDSRYALLWICVRDRGVYYAVGDSLFDVYTTKACSYIKVRTEKEFRKGNPQKAIDRCITQSINYGERSGVGRFFYEYGIAVFVILLLCFGISMGIVFRKRKHPIGK